MCLLIVLHRVHPEAPLIVAANRDEWLERPATPMTVLRQDSPRILGGRDQLAQGSWLAVNEDGVFAGLTNRPTLARDPSKRSRGELPLFLTAHRRASDAAVALRRTLRASDFGPAWLFVADRDQLFFVDMTEGDTPGVQELGAGIHVLENRSLSAMSPKVAHVRRGLAGVEGMMGESLLAQLSAVLRDHTIPDGANGESGVEGFVRPSETEANCVHAGPYGTRSSTVLLVGEQGVPRVWSSSGPPCTAPLVEQTELWSHKTRSAAPRSSD